MPLSKLPTDFKAENKSHVANLHAALSKLRLHVAPSAVIGKELDPTTTEAIKIIQKEFRRLPMVS